jgi:hypothetical protein
MFAKQFEATRRERLETHHQEAPANADGGKVGEGQGGASCCPIRCPQRFFVQFLSLEYYYNYMILLNIKP